MIDMIGYGSGQNTILEEYACELGEWYIMKIDRLGICDDEMDKNSNDTDHKNNIIKK